jgi:glycosyltransferase involved in cell wall biosynthesis
VRTELERLGIASVPWRAGDDPKSDWGDPSVRRREAYRLASEARAGVALLVLPWPSAASGTVAGFADAGLPALVIFQLSSELVPLTRHELEVCAAARATGQVWATVSEDNRRHLAATFDAAEGDFGVIPNGTDVSPTGTQPSDASRLRVRRDVRAELKIDEATPVALTVARLTEAKRHIDVLQAARDLPDIQLLWAGTGEAEATLRHAAAGLGDRVRFLGHRGDISRLLHASDLFVLPSDREGASFALLEAMAHGVPVVASDASSNRQILDGCGRTYPTGDVRALAHAIEAALRDHAGSTEAARRARSRVVAKYDERVLLRATIARLEKLALSWHGWAVPVTAGSG